MHATAGTSAEKLTEALKLLEEAAKDKKDELKDLVSEKYAHLKDALFDKEHQIGHTLSEARKRAADAMSHARDVSGEKAKELAQELDESVHKHPWPYIGGTAFVALLVGYILGRNR